MSAREIMEDLFFIERGYFNGNHFVYRSEEPVLIDTAYLTDFGETAKLIEDLGVNLSNVRSIVNTHCHCDHVGGNKIIQEKSNCDIALQKIGKHFIDTRDDWSTLWRYYGHKADFFSCTKGLEDNDVLSVGPHKFQVIHTPGHSPDGVVLYNSREKVLITGDTLWENDFPVPQLRVEGSTALFTMQKSLDKLEALDAKTVYPGHGRPFTDLKGAVSMCKKKTEDCMYNRELVGADILKKVIIFTLVAKSPIEKEEFFSYLMGMLWFKEIVNFYFNGDYQAKYNEIINGLLKRGIIKHNNGNLFTTINR
ncbi:MAG: MBL fold metallo-hydrolase [Syntrophales bacterium]|nr:MBL fold metallo-hydrolase [Syntrophales bacterium]